MTDEENKGGDERTPMPVFAAGERFQEKLYSIGDITLFRPLSWLEILVGIPLCALFCYFVVYPILSGQWAIAVFVVAVYVSPKALVWVEAKAGRPLVAEFVASVRFAYEKVMGYTIYQGVERLGRFDDTRCQRKRLARMLEEEDDAHDEIVANQTSMSRR